MSAHKNLTPQTARTDAEMAQLERDNLDTPEFWICVDAAAVTIAKQRSGEQATAEIQMPKTVFDQLVKFYLEG